MNKVKIKTKLLLGFLVVSLIAGIIGIIGYYSLTRQSKSLTNIEQNRLPSLEAFSEINKERMIIRSQTLEVIVAFNRSDLSAFKKELKVIQEKRTKSWTIVDKYWEISESIPRQSEEGKRLQQEIRAQYKAWRDMYIILDGLIEKMIQTDGSNLSALKNEYYATYEKMVPVSNTMGATFDLLKENNSKNTHTQVAETVSSGKTAQSFILIAIFIAISLAVFSGLWISSNIQKIIKSVIDQTNLLVDAAVAGKLSQRADVEKINFEFQEIPVGINKTLDALIEPLNVAADYVERISKGDIPTKIINNYNGDFNTIKNNLNQCIDAINLMVADANMLSNATIEGKLNTRADAAKHSGDFKKIIDGVNDTLDTLVGLLDVMPTPAMIIDKEFKIQYMNNAGAQVDNKTSKQVEGMRCYDHFRTEDCKTNNCACGRTMSTGINEKSETTARPGNLVLEIGYSAVPLKNKTGSIIGAFEVVTDQTAIKQAMRRAEKIGKYQTNEAVKLTDGLAKLSKGDLLFELKTEIADTDTVEAKKMFDEINDAVNRSVEAINLLVADANILAKAAVEGQLATRANAEKHQGEYRRIVEGVNNTLDSVIGPLNMAASYVDKIAKGDMPELITENYNGDFNNIKINLNSLIKAFNEIIVKAKMVSQGDLTVTLTKRSENDELMGALSDMVSRLSEIVSQVMEAAQNVATSSNEMSTSAVQISEGASEQSASAEEVSASIEEMTSSIQQNSDNSITTEKIAVASAQGMMDVNAAAQKSLEAMRKISEKIRIINDIAGKTDILAINAAIEAARAGEQGKGFAVVAAEVRKLAEVSQRAAVEINELSASSLRVTEDAGSLMMKIIPEVQKTAQLVKEIAASSNEQRMGSEQITKAVTQFTQVTQQNAAAAEEMSSSSEELATQAELLKETISFFNTGRQTKATQPGKPAHKVLRTKTNNTQKPVNHTADHLNGISVNLEGGDKDDKMFENF